MLRLSANLGFLWTDRPLLSRLDCAAAAGFGAVELHWPYDVDPSAVRDACEALGLDLVCINAPGGNLKDEFGFAAVAGRENDFGSSVAQACDYARRAGARAVHVLAGSVGPAQRPSAEKVFLRNIREASLRAEEQGLSILLEALNPVDRPGYFYHTTDEVARLIAELGRPNVRLMFDAYHVARAEGDVTRRLERYLPIVGHVQIAGVPNRTEPDQGEIAYRHVFSVLEELGYDGFVGCEYRPRGDVEEGLRWVEACGVSLARGFDETSPRSRRNTAADAG